MRHHLTVLTLAFLTLMPGISSAVFLESATATADCNGWATEVVVWIRPGAESVNLVTTVVLNDATGAEVERFETAEFLDFVEGDLNRFTLDGSWASPPLGAHEMVVDWFLEDIVVDGGNFFTAQATVALDCAADDPPEPVCIHARPWWRHHGEDWPVDSLELGGLTYGKSELMGILKVRPRGDVTVLLARQLIATKLNLASGTDGGISRVVDRADAYLVKHPLNSKPGWRARLSGRKLTWQLLMYNRRGCPDGAKYLAEYDSDEAELLEMEKEFVEPASFGAVKSMYR